MKQQKTKFRVWDKKNKVMYNSKNKLEFCSSFEKGWAFLELEGIETEDCILMQYTGLLDKNGKEIWEGDVVKFVAEDSIGIVYFASGEFLVKELPKENLVRLSWCKEHAEVIGNIMENPELLR